MCAWGRGGQVVPGINFQQRTSNMSPAGFLSPLSMPPFPLSKETIRGRTRLPPPGPGATWAASLVLLGSRTLGPGTVSLTCPLCGMLAAQEPFCRRGTGRGAGPWQGTGVSRLPSWGFHGGTRNSSDLCSPPLGAQTRGATKPGRQGTPVSRAARLLSGSGAGSGPHLAILISLRG